METARTASTSSESEESANKPFPDWKRSENDQHLLIALAVIALVLGGLGVRSFRSGTAADVTSVTVVSGVGDVPSAVAAYKGVTGVADGDVATLTGFVDTDQQSAAAANAAGAVSGISSVDNRLIVVQPGVVAALSGAGVAGATAQVDGLVATVGGEVASESARGAALTAAAAVPGVESVVDELTVAAAAPTTVAATTTVPATSTTSVASASDLTPDVAAAVASYTGVTGVADGDVAKLTGFVDTADVSAAAATAAAQVDGISTVDNQLVPVQPQVVAALTNAGVLEPVAEISDLVATARGTVANEELRTAALAAAAAVPGVASVVDELTIAAPAITEADTLAADLNALVEADPIQFGTNSADILAASNPTLDQAVTLIMNSSSTETIEVQGFTDIRGNAEANQALSESRAAAVMNYLVSKGVPADRLTSSGQGATNQFDQGTSPEAYALNRRVLFVVGA